MTPHTSANLIKLTTWGFIAFAFIWGLAPYTAINEPARLLIDIIDWPPGDANPALSRSQMWLSSIGAGLVLAICIMLLGIVVPAVRRSDKHIVRVTIWAFVGWFVVDSVGSVASGVLSNVFFNSILLAGILIPLLMLRYENEDV
jgi:hypothetical protein